MIELISLPLVFIFLVSTFVLTKVYPISVLDRPVYIELARMMKIARMRDKTNIKKKYDIERREEENEGLRIVLGKGEEGPVSLNMRHAPYIFIGGVPGAGKTNLLNNILLSVAEWTKNLKFFILTTHKGFSFRQFQKLLHTVNLGFEPHIWGDFLAEIEREVDYREKLIADASQKNLKIEDIASYNEVYQGDKLPYILLVIDEVQEIVRGEEGKKNLERILKIVRRGRSSGIFAILATQYLSAEEMTGKLLGNMVAKIALRTASAQDSKKILGVRGAELLDPSKGEAIISSPSQLNLKFAVRHLKTSNTPKIIKKINKKYGYQTF